MKALIVEDEVMAQDILMRALTNNFDDMEIVGVTDSVKSTVAWLSNPVNAPDVIFMDVELLDGSCFEIFRQVNISASVVMTTAFDKYAVKAFESAALDYLLKPYDVDALKRAVERCRARVGMFDQTSVMSVLRDLASNRIGSVSPYKKRFIVKVGHKIVPVDISQIAYFDAEGKTKSIVTRDGRQYLLDTTMDTLLEQLDPQQFFQISRDHIVASSAIKDIEKIYGGRLEIVMNTAKGERLAVARQRVNDFLAWLE